MKILSLLFLSLLLLPCNNTIIQVKTDIKNNSNLSLNFAGCDTNATFISEPDTLGFICEYPMLNNGYCYYFISNETNIEQIEILWYNNGYQEYYGISNLDMFNAIPIIESSGHVIFYISD